MKAEGSIFIITGAVSGLGLATAQNLHAAGAYVSLFDINFDTGAAVAKELGERALFFEVDVSESESIAKAIDGTVAWAKKTGKPIRGVVAAAGVGVPGKV
jgi:NAD(P)-dependent dehydrogenase (short-subunit alcohol dehydrogenase family)